MQEVLHVVWPGLVVSLQILSENSLVQFGLRQQFLRSAILKFQISQTLRFIRLHPAVLLLPMQLGRLFDFQSQHLSQSLAS